LSIIIRRRRTDDDDGTLVFDVLDERTKDDVNDEQQHEEDMVKLLAKDALSFSFSS